MDESIIANYQFGMAYESAIVQSQNIINYFESINN